MNDELKKQLADYLTNMEKAANSAGEFVIEQMPDVIQQYLAWEFYSNIFIAACCSIVSIFLIIMFRILYSIGKNDNWDNPAPIFGLIILFILNIVSGFHILFHTYSAVKVSVAPKVVLLEKAASLVSNGR